MGNTIQFQRGIGSSNGMFLGQLGRTRPLIADLAGGVWPGQSQAGQPLPRRQTGGNGPEDGQCDGPGLLARRSRPGPARELPGRLEQGARRTAQFGDERV